MISCGLPHPDDQLLADLQFVIRQDLAKRGLMSAVTSQHGLCDGHLARSAKDLVGNGQRILLVTGFFIPGAIPSAAETDGPPGAALLAKAILELGLTCQIVTDEPCESAVVEAANSMGFPLHEVLVCPASRAEQDAWFEMLLTPGHWGGLPQVTHLISIERVGPSHTRESIQQQVKLDKPRSRQDPLSEIADEQVSNPSTDFERASILLEFEREVPASDRNQCYNMRGESIDACSAPLYRLFELARTRQKIHTIGIGDGGNEIGMGSIPWWELKSRLSGSQAGKVPCRIATDWTIVAGVSNWGAQALAAALLQLSGKADVARSWTSQQQLDCLERIVRFGPAVDGVTRLAEPTVDGLPFHEYIQPWEKIRRLIGLENE